MKYGYVFSDWGLFLMIPILSTQEVSEDFEYNGAKFQKDKYCLAVLEEDGRIVPFLKNHIFDTKEECHNYGLKHTY